MGTNGWLTLTLGSIAVPEYGLVDGPFGSNLPASLYTSEGVPVVRGSNLSLGKSRFKSHEFVFVSDETANSLSRSLCFPDDIIFTKKGTLGQTGIIPRNSKFSKFLLSSNQMKLTVSKEIADPLFVYYYVSSPRCREQIVRESTASGVPKINVAYLRQFPIVLPPTNEQRAIARILGALDDKIELNRQTNHTLEAMAQSVFKSWFVDFDPVATKAAERTPAWMNADTAALFPTRFVESSLGLIPEGWHIGKVSNLGEVICGKTPSTKEQDNFGNDIPFITIPDMHNNIFITRTERSLSLKGANSQTKKFLPANSICVSCIATPGLVCLTTKKSQTNQQINSVIPQSSISPYFCYWLLRGLGDEIKAGGSAGTVFHNLNTGNFSQIEIILPSSLLIEKFHSTCEGMMQKIVGNQEESETLAALRDSLLPKLLSGEIQVGQAEKIMAETI